MFSPDEGHSATFNKKPILRFEESANFEPQRTAIKSKLFELLGDMPEKVSLDPVIESKNEHETFTEYRIVFNTEKMFRRYVCSVFLNWGKGNTRL